MLYVSSLLFTSFASFSIAAEQSVVENSKLSEEQFVEKLKLGREVIKKACMWCHTLDPILASTSTSWDIVIQDMKNRGAIISNDDAEILNWYLSYLTQKCANQ